MIHQTSYAYTPQHNGVAECKNRHLVEITRTILLHHHVLQHLWGDAIFTACYLINCMPSSVLQDQVPHSLIFSNQPLFVFPHVCLDAPTLCIFLLLAKTSSQLSPRTASSLVIPNFNEVIGAILLIHIDTSYLLMSCSLSSLLSYLLPTLMSYLYYLTY